ncbi:DUF2336 domain-containing protein [Roseibium sp. CAU 1637]|uniref:DUF2336 domain-containing protein n=1 Tax=Roseibium limicola TaxID=2816037 RepID=A0A939ELY0_9HYPH|nr:DUF2336 domain-containing protein [Roseibium limicola]MBO0343728.1 DUF2336 domain-containing protein [Roseibium limicola]
MLNLSMFSDLAKDGSKNGRKNLITAVTDLFLASKNTEAEQVSLLFGDIVMRVLGELEEETRMALSQKVCSHPAAPKDLISSLAKDSIVVAKPVLEQSPVLTNEELAGLAESESMQHLGAIADREGLDEQVTEALVNHGDEEVLTKVANNSGARMAQQTFTQLVEKARSNTPLLEALVKREDLPEAIIKNLGDMVSDELRERLGKGGENETLATTLAGRAMEEVKARASRVGQSMEQAKKVIMAVRAKKTSLEDAVGLFAKGDKAAELGILLATVNSLPAASISSLIYAKSDKPLIILCKANDLDVSAFKHILTMRARRLGTGVHELNDAMKRYEAFTVDSAKTALAGLRASLAGPPDDPEEEETADAGVFLTKRKRPAVQGS